MSLARLEAAVRRELDLLRYPERSWLTPRTTHAGAPILDVLIVGGGQGGLATAFGLKRERVDNVLVVDENPLDRAGPWLRFARMNTLRTPKYLTGPDLGLPSLTPRAYYEALHGEGSWEPLRFLPRELWAAYLAWYRTVLALPVRADTRVGALSYSVKERAFEVPCTTGGETDTLYARRVVLATGIEGSGVWHVPPQISATLPRSAWAHTHEAIDFDALRGARVLVLGAGASAFDNAAHALESGAREAHLFFRRAALPCVNPYRWAEFTGFLKHFGDLPDAARWRFMLQVLRMGQLPPADTLARATAQPGFHLHPGATLRALDRRGDTIALRTDEGTFEGDFLIVGTGFVTDLAQRPELTRFAPQIARWSDRYTPPDDARHEDLARHPYLGPSFEHTARTEGEAPHLAHLFNYTFGSLLSLGFSGASISGMKYSLPRLVSGITRSLFLEDGESYYQSLCAYDVKEY